MELNGVVQSLHEAAEPERYAGTSPGSVRAWFAEQLARADAELLVAERAGALVGYVLLFRRDIPASPFTPARRFVHVDQLAVAATAWRSGVGRARMDAAQARDEGGGVELDVRAFNARALRFYEALGYRAIQVRMRRGP